MPWDHNQQPWALTSTYSWSWFLECGIVRLNTSTEEHRCWIPITCHQPGEAPQGAPPHLQLLEGILVAVSRIVQTQTAGTLGSALPWLSRAAACVLAVSSSALTPSPACTVILTLEIPSTLHTALVSPELCNTSLFCLFISLFLFIFFKTIILCLWLLKVTD